MMWKAVATGRPLGALARGVAMRGYLPGLSLVPARRRVTRKVLAPALPVSVKLPRSVTIRVHGLPLRFCLVGARQRGFLPGPVLRPGWACWTVNRTEAASLSR